MKKLLKSLALLLIFTTPNITFAALIQNGGFESGDLTSWTTSSSTSYDSHVGVSTTSHTGNYSVSLSSESQASAPAMLWQTFNTTINAQYQLTFWANDNLSGIASVDFLDNTNNSFYGQYLQSTYLWTKYTVDFLASSLSTTVQFSAFSFGQPLVFDPITGSPLNLSAYQPVDLSLDDISIKQLSSPQGGPSAVPLPAAAFMFAPALLGFLGFRRKLKA